MAKQLDAHALLDATIGVAAHLESELEEALAEHRLSRASYQVLAALEAAPGHALSQRELVATVRRTSGTMSVRLGRLEHAGMITRERAPEDGRNVTVTLTEPGHALVRAAAPTYGDRSERLLEGLAPDARAALDAHVPAWLAFFEPDERVTPRLGVAVAPSAVAARMRRAVGLSQEPGVLVLRVVPGSPAEQADLSRGDLIVTVDGAPIRSIGELDRAVRTAQTDLRLSVLRGAEPRDISVRFE
jgi:DNA-binding MarR family transcriptional regulator